MGNQFFSDDICPTNELVCIDRKDADNPEELIGTRFSFSNPWLTNYQANKMLYWLQSSVGHQAAIENEHMFSEATKPGRQDTISELSPQSQLQVNSITRYKRCAEVWEADHDKAILARCFDRTEVGSKLLILATNWIKNCVLWKQLPLPNRVS